MELGTLLSAKTVAVVRRLLLPLISTSLVLVLEYGRTSTVLYTLNTCTSIEVPL